MRQKASYINLISIFLFFVSLSEVKGQIYDAKIYETNPVQNSGRPSDTTIVLLFKSDKFELDSTAKSQLQEAYARLIAGDSTIYYRLEISGYADFSGNDTMNYILSENRARVAGNYFISLANDTVIKKTGVADFMTPCNGAIWIKFHYNLPIRYLYFGSNGAKLNRLDSLNMAYQRKVLLHFKIDNNACSGGIRDCSLPASDTTFYRDSTIRVLIPTGSINRYITGSGLPPCTFTGVRLDINFEDSLPTMDNLCEKISSTFYSKQKSPEIKIGSLAFIIKTNDTIVTHVCQGSPGYNMARVSFSEKLIPISNFKLYDEHQELLTYNIKNGFIETEIQINKQHTINLFMPNSSYRLIKVIIAGPDIFEISGIEPIQKCMVSFKKQASRKTIFSRRTTYLIMKFNTGNNMIYLDNQSTHQTFTISLSALKYSNSNSAYVLKKKQIKQLLKKQQ